MKSRHRRLLAVVALTATALPAQAGPAVRERPFGVGERAEYQVRLGAIVVGSGAIEVVGLERVAGHPVFHTRMRISGGVPLARVDDRFESWIDTAGIFSRRFHQNQHEVRYRRNRTYDFNPEARTWRRENGETGDLASDRPLDDLSFLFYARTLPLDEGATYTLRRYFKDSGNPVVLRVLRRDTVRVPEGTFRTIVVQPVIQTKGLFSEGGQAEVHFSDDERRIVVMIRSRVPRIGTLTLSLRDYQPPR